MATVKRLFSWRASIMESDLSAPTKLVALALATYMSDRGDQCHPGPTRLARDTSLHVSTVKERLKELERAGWLTCVRRGGIKGQTRFANEYVATVPDMPLFLHNPSPTAPGATGNPSPLAQIPVAHGDPTSPMTSPIERGAHSAPTTTRGTRVPDPFDVTGPMIAWALERCPGIDWERETEKFVNYWTAASGRTATKRDWVAAWRNWMFKADDYAGARR